MAEINFGKSITLKQAANLIRTNPETRFLLQGEPGIGKSSLLQDVADSLGYESAYIDVPNMDLGDIAMPVIDHETKTTRYYPNARFKLHEGKPVVVMLDGELGGDVVNLAEVQDVTVTTVELCLTGCDLVDEPELRRGLVALWLGEADTAGLDIDSLTALGDGRCDEPGHWCLAELHSGGERYVLRAAALPHDPDIVRVRAESTP